MLTMNSDSNLPKFDKQTRTHSSKVLHIMNEHRKENTKLCDISLQVNDKLFPVHRSVLSACSPYFLAMFNGDMKESKQKVVELKDVREDTLEDIIDFVYTGILNINSHNVENILKLSTQLQFCEVREIACDFLEHQLDPMNCIGIRRFVVLHHCKSFLYTVDCFIKRHFSEVLNSEEFVCIPFDALKDILSSSELNVNCEARVYNSVLKWVNHDITERGPKLYELLSVTRLPLLPKQFLMNHVDNEPLIKNNLNCRDLLDEAKNYHLSPENRAALRSSRTMPRFSTSGLLFAVGGKEAGELITNKAECFSIYDNHWIEIAPLSQPRQQLGVCELHQKIYAIAGSDGINRSDSVEIYCPKKRIWETGKPLQTCRSGVVACVMGDAIYAVGGYDGRFCVNSVERFDPAKQTWEYVASTNLARSFPGVASLEHRIFVVGGNDGMAFLDSCECYDPLTDKWTFITPMNTTRAGVGCAVLDGVLYVAGGFDGTKRSNVVEMYEPRINEWREVSPMKYSRDGCCMTSYGGYLFAIGGIDGPSYLNTVEYYDPTTDSWNDAFPMETSRAAAGVAVLPWDFPIET